jgi:(1->4)-alpha-D-glucan 1-alpha-D-glucosylmutase
VRRVAERAGLLGASFLGLSPVHALFSADRTKISPYSPSSRLFLETIFIDPTEVEGFAGSRAERLLADPQVQSRLAALRAASLIDHAAVWEVKRPLLEALWADFRSRGRHRDLRHVPARRWGAPLVAHATFRGPVRALRKRSAGGSATGRRPSATRNRRRSCASPPSARERVAFHAWLQWIADRQLQAASRRARESGMLIGLYRDLAVGGDAGGSEIWAAPERSRRGSRSGRLPIFSARPAQNWGLPPFNPLTLEMQGLAAFRALVRANMRHAGAIRIDHAFQLQRLFLIPQGASAAQGAYVEYPFEGDARRAAPREPPRARPRHRRGPRHVPEDFRTPSWRPEC